MHAPRVTGLVTGSRDPARDRARLPALSARQRLLSCDRQARGGPRPWTSGASGPSEYGMRNTVRSLWRKQASSRARQPLRTATCDPHSHPPRPKQPRLSVIPYTPPQTTELSIQAARRSAERAACGPAMTRGLSPACPSPRCTGPPPRGACTGPAAGASGPARARSARSRAPARTGRSGSRSARSARSPPARQHTQHGRSLARGARLQHAQHAGVHACNMHITQERSLQPMSHLMTHQRPAYPGRAARKRAS